MTVTPELRTKVLAAVAGVAVVGYAISLVVSSGVPAAAPAGGGDVAARGSAVVVLAGAPRDLDAKGLTERYAPIRKARPFQSRSFLPPAPPKPAGQPARPALGEAQPVSKPRDPEKLELRFSGILGQGDERQAVLEELSGSGRGLLAKAGTSLATVEVAAVGTWTLTVVENAQRKELELGSPYAFPVALTSKVEQLKPTTSIAAVPGASNDGTLGKPQPTDDEKKATLERLRARRRGQLPGQQQPATETPPAAPTEAAPATPPADPAAPTPEQLQEQLNRLQQLGDQLEQQLQTPPPDAPRPQGGE